MSDTKIKNLRSQVRSIGYKLAMIEKRGLRDKNDLARRLAHNLLLNQLYELEKRV
jgi:hypothetical protein